ncbi:MAG: hypothetical protein ACKVOF_00835 [Pseudohongiellaceae bacterium]|jgi:hypothetical protein
MRGLAEYAMTGRRQAITVAVLFGLVPLFYLLSAAVVALVVLRKGLQEGLLVLLWALLPAGLQWLTGDTSYVFVLLGVALLANVLRATGSWSKALLVTTVLGLILQISLVVQTGYVTKIETAVGELMANGQILQLPQDGQMTAATPTEVVALLMSFYGAYHMLMLVSSLLLARAWQARLYNPGGFQQEFHNLRIAPGILLVLLSLLLASWYGLQPLADWLPIFCMVPMLTGLAVIHSVVANRKLGKSWLVMAYLVLLLMPPVIIMLGFADGAIDIRLRLNKLTKD